MLVYLSSKPEWTGAEVITDKLGQYRGCGHAEVFSTLVVSNSIQVIVLANDTSCSGWHEEFCSNSAEKSIISSHLFSGSFLESSRKSLTGCRNHLSL